MTNETSDQLRLAILRLLAEIYQGQNSSTEIPAMNDETVLLQSGVDSLGFAILVTRLEEELGYDPFSLSAEAYYPRTLGEFVAFYRKYAPPTSG